MLKQKITNKEIENLLICYHNTNNKILEKHILEYFNSKCSIHSDLVCNVLNSEEYIIRETYNDYTDGICTTTISIKDLKSKYFYEISIPISLEYIDNCLYDDKICIPVIERWEIKNYKTLSKEITDYKDIINFIAEGRKEIK